MIMNYTRGVFNMSSLELLSKHTRQLIDDWNERNKEDDPSEMVTKVEEVVAEDYVPKFNFLTPEMMIHDIFSVVLSNRFYALSLCGPQGTGKTVAASVFATYAKRAGYRLVYALPEDFM